MVKAVLCAALDLGLFAVVRAETPALTDLPLLTSVTQHDITWTFSPTARVGQFVNGDYYVVGATTVTAISPAPTSNRNGSVLNVPLDNGKSGFDDRVTGGRWDPSYRANLPISLKPGDALVSSKSVATVAEYSGMLRPQEKSLSPVWSYSVLTCLSAPVAYDAFRPSYADRGQKIYHAGSLRRKLLPSLPKVASTPSLAEFAGYFRQPWLDICFFCFDAAVEYQPQYAREIGRAEGMASLLLMLDFTPAQKETLLVNFVQHGIDLWGLVRAGYYGWNALGGHGTGRKWAIVFAGIMLGDTAMASPSKTYPNVRFGQDMQTMYDNGWTGAKVVYAGHEGVWNGQPVSSLAYNRPYEHLRPRDWTPQNSTAYICETYRRCCTSIAWIGQALTGRIMQAEKYYDHNAFFDYCDRWMTENDLPFLKEIQEATGQDYAAGYTLQRQAWDAFVNVMWATYRNNLPQPIKAIPDQEVEKSKILTVAFGPHPMQDRLEICLNGSTGTRVEIFTMAGMLTRRLDIPEGAQAATWDGKDTLGRAVEPGIYYARCGDWFKKLILVKGN